MNPRRLGGVPCPAAQACDTIDRMHEVFEHTADLGLRVRAADLNALFGEAGQALFEAICPDLDSVRPERRLDVTIAGTDRDYLLFDWLKELLYHFDAGHLLLSRFDLNVQGDGLTAVVWGELLDADRHILEHEVKAVTYHGLKVEEVADGWLAEVIVDI